jgi:hypothetical protein
MELIFLRRSRRETFTSDDKSPLAPVEIAGSEQQGSTRKQQKQQVASRQQKSLPPERPGSTRTS